MGSGQLHPKACVHWGSSALAAHGRRQMCFGWGGLTSACVEVTPSHLPRSVAVKGRGMRLEGE